MNTNLPYPITIKKKKETACLRQSNTELKIILVNVQRDSKNLNLT